MFPSLTMREKIALSVLFPLITIFLYFSWIYPPLAAEKERVSTELAGLESERKLITGRIERISELEEELEKLREKREEILAGQIFEIEELLIPLLEIVMGVGLDPVHYQPSVRDDGFAVILQIEGAYGPIVNLLKILDKLDPRLEIVYMELTSQGGDLSLELDLFYQTVEEEFR